jgi:acid phosphatase family membrane protein YuiD
MSLQDLPIYLIAIVAGWILAHVVKYIIALAKRNNRKFREQVFISGGMPSAHATTVAALTTVIGLTEGFSSATFALGVMFLLIITHDAVRVRRASGEQGEALSQLIKEAKSKIILGRSHKGHTIAEVAVGWIFGILIGLAVFAIFAN